MLFTTRNILRIPGSAESVQWAGRLSSGLLLSKRARVCSIIFATLVMMASLVSATTQASDALPTADLVVVNKSERWLRLYRDDEILREFPIALGAEPKGDKEQEGDNRTPEGRYLLDMRNTQSSFFLSIRVSYPSPGDVREARSKGVAPGGQIMIHGQPNEPTYSPGYYASTDWTNGCIAVSNAAMIDIWLMTESMTPIEILP
ncbi:MAG: L,D-transpeptidase family protein [Pseudomonadota bacterium]